MSTVIDFQRYASEFSAETAPRVFSAKSFRNSHLLEIQSRFEKYRLTRLWCGYAFLNDIPGSCEQVVHMVAPQEHVGTALFTNSKEHTQFIFRDFNNLFCLTNTQGLILDQHSRLSGLLDSFQQKLLR